MNEPIISTRPVLGSDAPSCLSRIDHQRLRTVRVGGPSATAPSSTGSRSDGGYDAQPKSLAAFLATLPVIVSINQIVAEQHVSKGLIEERVRKQHFLPPMHLGGRRVWLQGEIADLHADWSQWERMSDARHRSIEARHVERIVLLQQTLEVTRGRLTDFDGTVESRSGGLRTIRGFVTMKSACRTQGHLSLEVIPYTYGSARRKRSWRLGGLPQLRRDGRTLFRTLDIVFYNLEALLTDAEAMSPAKVPR